MRARYKDKKSQETNKNDKDNQTFTNKKMINNDFRIPNIKKFQPKIQTIELKNPKTVSPVTANINLEDIKQRRAYRRESPINNNQLKERENDFKTNIHLNPFFNFSNTNKRNKQNIFNERYRDALNSKMDNIKNKMETQTISISNRKNYNTIIGSSKDYNGENTTNSLFLKYKSKHNLKKEININFYDKNDNINDDKNNNINYNKNNNINDDINENTHKIYNNIDNKNKHKTIEHWSDIENDIKNDVKNENKNSNGKEENYNKEDNNYYNNKNEVIKNVNFKLDFNNTEKNISTNTKILSVRNYNKTKIAAKKIYELINDIYLKLYYPIFYSRLKLFLKFRRIYQNKSLIHKLLIFNDNKNLKIFFENYHKIILKERKKFELVKKIFEVYKKNELYELRRHFDRWKNKNKEIKINKRRKMEILKRNQSSGKKFIKIKMKCRKSISHKNSFASDISDSNDQKSISSIGYNSLLGRHNSSSHLKKMKVIFVRPFNNKIVNSFLGEQHKTLRENLKKSQFFRKIINVIYKVGNKKLMFKYFKQWKKKRNRTLK